MDEFTHPLQYGWLVCSEVFRWLKEHKPSRLHLIITGREAPKDLIEMADLVTEMKSIRHPYEHGIKAQPGIEF